MKTIESPSRRRFALQLVLAGAASCVMARRLVAMSKLPEGRSIFRLRGKVRVNGRVATEDSVILAGDTIETGTDGEIVFAVGRDAFLLRANGRVELSGREKVIGFLRVVTGKLLSVYGSGEKQIRTPVATIGIRGTGTYIEVDPGRTYLCTCYGKVDLVANADPSVRERLHTSYHESPRYVVAGDGAVRIEVAPVINHTDAELSLVESLVGRVPLFQRGSDAGGGGSY